jgi:hypothetical protein
MSEMAKALPLMIQLMNNPSFVKHASEAGYEFDANAIFRAWANTVVYTPDVPIRTTGMRKRKPRLTASDFVMLREMGIKL